jgi:hypothetical protein
MENRQIIFEINQMRKFMNLPLLMEDSRFEILYNKYISKNKELTNNNFNFDKLKTLIFTDPTTLPQIDDYQDMTVEDMKEVKVGKYTNWLIKLYFKPESTERISLETHQRLMIEDSGKIKFLLKQFDRFKNLILDPSKKDINKITSIDELYSLPVKIGNDGSTELLGKYKPKKVNSKKDSQSGLRDKFEYPGSSIVFEGPNYTVVKISEENEAGQRAASYFGGYYLSPSANETSWCTSPVNSNYFKSYVSKGPLYVILPNTDTEFGEKSGLPANRYQFWIGNNNDVQFKNAADLDIDDRGYAALFMDGGQFEELREFFRPEFDKIIKNIVSNDKVGFKIELNSSSESVINNYVKLYGLNNIWKEIPSTITDFAITNNGEFVDLINNNPDNEYSNNFKRFKDNLLAFTLENVASEIPDVFDGFSKLFAVNLSNNPIKELPESLLRNRNVKMIICKNTQIRYNEDDLKKYGKIYKSERIINI